MNVIGFAATLFTSVSLVPALGQSVVQAQLITISSTHDGWGHTEANLAISRDGDHYVANHRTVPAKVVQDFLDAVTEPLIAKPDPVNMGITDRWLLEHTEEAGDDALIFNYRDGSPDQKDIFRKAFVDHDTIQPRLETVFEGNHTDDYPQITIKIQFDDRTTRTVSSDSQNPFMVPWSVDGAGSKTFNVHISRALMELLPEGFVNRERLTAEERFALGLLHELAFETAREVAELWKLAGGQRPAGRVAR
jgi:hypothetical protein